MSDRLQRRLGLSDAVMIGLGSMVGAGIFAAFGPAAQAAGPSLLVGLALAAAVAYCNATSSAQLAAAYPTSGGTYIYGRERLGEWAGFLAGWGFLVGKTASCAAMALTFATYAVPDATVLRRVVAVLAVVALTALNYRGVTRTAAAAKVLVTVTVGCLLALVVAAWSRAPKVTLTSAEAFWGGGIHGTLQSAGLLFFAFAGYARIATMGEEVKDPRTTIPRAILLALLGAVALYAVVAATALVFVGASDLAGSGAPLATLAHATGVPGMPAVVRVGGAVASLGALLALIAGVGRTSLAMARHGDLPAWLSAVHPRFSVPHHAEIALAVVVCALVASVDLPEAIGFSSFGVLVYYLIANLAAYTQTGSDRRWPRGLQVAGALACALLVATLPAGAIAGGVVVFAAGVVGRLAVHGRPVRG